MKIGLIGAMTVEVEALRDEMENAVRTVVSGMEFWEGRLCGQDVVLAVAGIGKVNAAMCAQTMILRFAPDAVLNTGVAGGIGSGVKILDVVVADAVAQHDMDTSPLGDPVGLIPGLNVVEMKCDEALCDRACAAARSVGVEPVRGLIVSGDQFIGSQAQIDRIRAHFDARAAEMEGAAIGQVCAINRVPFTVIRAISDGGDADAQMDYPQFVKLAAARSVRIVEAFLRL